MQTWSVSLFWPPTSFFLGEPPKETMQKWIRAACKMGLTEEYRIENVLQTSTDDLKHTANKPT
jgi:hypothetical protein